jgi:hypothetical protein
MAQFISITSSAAGLQGGEYLINIDKILFLDGSDESTEIYLKGADGSSYVSTEYDTLSSSYIVSRAIIKAMTSNPGGKKVKVTLPAGVSLTSISVGS